jgi:glycosyltransferase involved in cell wall biosynthesis
MTWSDEVRRLGRSTERGIDIVRLPVLQQWSGEPGIVSRYINAATRLISGILVGIYLRRRWTVIYAAGLNPEGLIAALLGYVTRRRAVLGTWLPGPRGNVARLEASPAAPLVKRLLRGAGAFVAETPTVARELTSAGFDRDRIRLIRHGVDLNKYRPAQEVERQEAKQCLSLEGRSVVAYTGRFDLRQKRLDLLLSAWEKAALDGWILVLTGDGEDRCEIERQARQLSNSPMLLGWQEDTRSILDAVDVFVLPTEFEGTALGMVEAMACAIPGIVSDVLAMPDMDGCGVYAVPNDADSWATALRKLASSPEERERRSHRVRAWAEAHGDQHETVVSFKEVLGL